MKTKVLSILISLIFLCLDQLSKAYIRNNFALGETRVLIKNIFQITYIENPGIAFGLFSGKSLLFVFFSIIVLAFLLFYLYKEMKSQKMILGLAMVFSGAVGNIIDRVMKNSVTDMFDFIIWPVFNIADICVCVGFGILAYQLLFNADDDYEA